MLEGGEGEDQWARVVRLCELSQQTELLCGQCIPQRMEWSISEGKLSK